MSNVFGNNRRVQYQMMSYELNKCLHLMIREGRRDLYVTVFSILLSSILRKSIITFNKNLLNTNNYRQCKSKIIQSPKNIVICNDFCLLGILLEL